MCTFLPEESDPIENWESEGGRMPFKPVKHTGKNNEIHDGKMSECKECNAE